MWQGASLAKRIGAFKYLECSAKTREGMREVFETASRMALASIEKDGKRKVLRRLFARFVT
jgi:Ras homolog gene family, member A